MTKADKTLAKMRNNPRDWRINDLKAIVDQRGIEYRHHSTSHVTFCRDDLMVTVPAHRPIKPVYIRQFLAFLDRI